MKKRAKLLLFVYVILLVGLFVFKDGLIGFAKNFTIPDNTIWGDLYVGKIVKPNYVIENVKYSYADFIYIDKDGVETVDKSEYSKAHTQYVVKNGINNGVYAWVIDDVRFYGDYIIELSFREVTQNIDVAKVNTVGKKETATFHIDDLSECCSADWYNVRYETMNLPLSYGSGSQMQKNSDGSYYINTDSSYRIDNISEGSIVSFELSRSDSDSHARLYSRNRNFPLDNGLYNFTITDSDYINFDFYGYGRMTIRDLVILRPIYTRLKSEDNVLSVSSSSNSKYFTSGSKFFARVRDCNGNIYDTDIIDLSIADVDYISPVTNNPNTNGSWYIIAIMSLVLMFVLCLFVINRKIENC